MSIQAVSWAIEDAPDVPPNLVSTLIAVANHADRNGRGAYPSTETVAHYARKSPRQAQRDLDQLETLGLIRRGDQRFVLHVRPDRRPVVWDLALDRRRLGRDDTHVTPPTDHGVTSTTERGDTQGSHGVTPMSPEPSLEPTPRTEENSDANASGASAPRIDGDTQLLLDLPVPASKAKGSKTARMKTSNAGLTARDVTAAWIDANRANNVEPTRAQIGQVSKTAKELLLHNDADRVLAAARSAGGKGFTGIDRELTRLAALTNGRSATLSNGHRPYADKRDDTVYAGGLR